MVPHTRQELDQVEKGLPRSYLDRSFPILNFYVDGVENVLFLYIIIQILSHRRNVEKLSLLYRNFYGSFSVKLHSLDTLVITFAFKTHQATYIVENNLHLLCHPFIRSKFHRAASSRRPLLCKPNFHDHVSRLRHS